jgi:hypothetical protein
MEKDLPRENRKQIAKDLLKGCPTTSRQDHAVIARAVSRGDSLSQILNLPETGRWPDTYTWLWEQGISKK